HQPKTEMKPRMDTDEHGYWGEKVMSKSDPCVSVFIRGSNRLAAHTYFPMRMARSRFTVSGMRARSVMMACSSARAGAGPRRMQVRQRTGDHALGGGDVFVQNAQDLPDDHVGFSRVPAVVI